MLEKKLNEQIMTCSIWLSPNYVLQMMGDGIVRGGFCKTRLE